MSRKIHRVPVDFDWPLNKVWQGYLEPDELRGEPCPACNASGQTHFGWWLQRMSYVMGMLADDVREQERGKPLHPWLRDFPNAHGHWENHQWVTDRPSPDALEFFARLMDVDPSEITGSLFGKDTHYAVLRKLLEITGVDVGCQTCEGHGSTEKYPGQRAEAEAWEPTGPPEGDGWQLWESVSEGSPISPVFADREGLIHWLTTDYSWGAQRTPLTREQAEAFVGAGSSIGSFVMTGDGRQISGEAAVYELSREG